MPHVQVKQKYQVTIPASIRKKIDLNEGDMLEAVERGGIIVLIPKALTSKKNAGKPSLLSLTGANKGSGLYASAQEIDDYIAGIRDEWQ